MKEEEEGWWCSEGHHCMQRCPFEAAAPAPGDSGDFGVRSNVC